MGTGGEIEHDERQLRRMLECLEAARRGGVSLRAASDSLLFLRGALERADRPWADDFTSHLATLESASLASPAQRQEMGDQFPRLVEGTLDALEKIVRARLEGA
jgi:hypothetical protein